MIARRPLVVCVAAAIAPIACGSSGAPPAAPASDAGGGSGGGSGGGGAIPDAGPPLPTCDPGASDVAFTIDATKDAHPISPWIYGTNLEGAWSGEAKNLTLARAGGNRWTAYDWETNASNAGSDYQYDSDDYLGGGATAGAAVRSRVQAAFAGGASIVVTIPIQGWVAADENGPVPLSLTDLSSRFHATSTSKGSPLAYPPDTSDATVYEDEFVAWLESQFPDAHGATGAILYSLDNEPDLWASTHAEIQKSPLTYADLVAKSIATATMIKKLAPQALVLGPASYGWQGYVNLQNAPDANGRDFLEYYLDRMKAAEATAGHRLVDVLDLHWYPEATGGGVRITDDGATPSQAEIDARVQAPRSLWDATYVETSWITQSLKNQAIDLLPRVQAKIAAHYPGTRLSFSEYDYGGGQDVSGAIAQADVLGIFGRDGVFAATHWPLTNDEKFVYAGFAAFRSYDGATGAFGDTSIHADTSDPVRTSVYASVDSQAPGRVTLIAINKTSAAVRAGVRVAYGGSITRAEVYQVTSAGPAPVKAASAPTPSCQSFVLAMPPRSVSTVVLR